MLLIIKVIFQATLQQRRCRWQTSWPIYSEPTPKSFHTPFALFLNGVVEFLRFLNEN